MDVDVVVDWEVPEVPEPADFGDALHSPDKFLKVTSAKATAVDVVDGGGTIISRLFQAQVIRRGSGQNRVVECPFWAVAVDPSLQSKGRTEQQARGSRRPRPTTTPREAAQAAQAAGDGAGAREKAEILRLEAENKLLREQLKAAEAARKTAQDALTGERALWDGMQRSRAWCGTPPILGVVNMVGTRNFTCYMGAL